MGCCTITPIDPIQLKLIIDNAPINIIHLPVGVKFMSLKFIFVFPGKLRVFVIPTRFVGGFPLL